MTNTFVTSRCHFEGRKIFINVWRINASPMRGLKLVRKVQWNHLASSINSSASLKFGPVYPEFSEVVSDQLRLNTSAKYLLNGKCLLSAGSRLYRLLCIRKNKTMWGWGLRCVKLRYWQMQTFISLIFFLFLFNQTKKWPSDLKHIEPVLCHCQILRIKCVSAVIIIHL